MPFLYESYKHERQIAFLSRGNSFMKQTAEINNILQSRTESQLILVSSYSFWSVRIHFGQFVFILVSSYSFWSVRTHFGQFVLILVSSYSFWSVRIHFGQFVLILVSSYSFCQPINYIYSKYMVHVFEGM